MGLRKDDDGGETIGVLMNGARHAAGGLEKSVAAVLASAVQGEDDRPTRGAVEFARDVDLIAIFGPID
jgi:hypothetical protein